jgi:hypothetical protein
MKIHYRKYCKIQTKVIKEAEHMHYNKKILESDKAKAIWKNLKKERGKYSTEKVTPSIKINKNIIKSPKLIVNFQYVLPNNYRRMNNDTTTITTEDAIKYLTKAIPGTFPNINLMCITANETKIII